MSNTIRINDNLDNLHKIKLLLGQISNNSKYKKLVDDLPQVCTFGAQSSGKSSVLTRMTGIKFPSSSGTCSRIATHIMSRRGEHDKVKIYLQNTTDSSKMENIYETVTKTDPNIEVSLKKAQMRALQLSQNKSFVTDWIINVYVVGKTILNSNLVDLPGFNTDNVQDRITVENICKKYLEMEGTIALHVCRADVDHNVQAGNDIIKSYPSLKKILVLTYCDNVSDDRIREITKKTIDSNNKYRKIAVCGNFNGSYDDEENELNKFVGLFSIGLGTKFLNNDIEILMNSHISKQIPVLMSELTTELRKNRDELMELNNESPLDVLLKIFQRIEKNILEQQRDLENKIRLLLEQMKNDILNTHITIYNGGKIYDSTTDEPLQVGMFVDIREIKGMKKRDTSQEKQSGFVPLVTNIVTGNGYSNSYRSDEKKSGFTPLSDVVSYGNWTGLRRIISIKNGVIMLEENDKEFHMANCEITIRENDKNTVIEKIKDILNKERGLVNIGHTDIHPAIEYFAEEFAKEYGSILGTYTVKIVNVMKKFVDDIVNFNIEHHVLESVNKKKRDFMSIISENKDKFSERIIELVKCNMKPLVYSSNEYALNVTYNEMIKGKSFDTDDGVYEQIYFKAKAYLKGQKVYVIEDATKKALLILYSNSYSKIKNSIYNSLSEYSQMIELPPERQLRINELNKNILVIQEVLGLL